MKRCPGPHRIAGRRLIGPDLMDRYIFILRLEIHNALFVGMPWKCPVDGTECKVTEIEFRSHVHSRMSRISFHLCYRGCYKILGYFLLHKFVGPFYSF
jgi:hypothetical protein